MGNEAISSEVKREDTQKKILIFGITGMMTDYEMYTGLLVTKMNKRIREQNIKAIVQAYSVSKINEKGKEADCILLCPELSYVQEEMSSKFPHIAVKTISKKEYATLDSEKVLAEALSALV